MNRHLARSRPRAAPGFVRRAYYITGGLVVAVVVSVALLDAWFDAGAAPIPFVVTEYVLAVGVGLWIAAIGGRRAVALIAFAGSVVLIAAVLRHGPVGNRPPGGYYVRVIVWGIIIPACAIAAVVLPLHARREAGADDGEAA